MQYHLPDILILFKDVFPLYQYHQIKSDVRFFLGEVLLVVLAYRYQNAIFENGGTNLNNEPNVDSSNSISWFSSERERHKTYLMKNEYLQKNMKRYLEIQNLTSTHSMWIAIK